MEYKELKEIIKDMEESKLESLEIEFPDGTRISMTNGYGENVGADSISARAHMECAPTECATK